MIRKSNSRKSKKIKIKHIVYVVISIFATYICLRSVYLYNQDNVYSIAFHPKQYYLDFGYFKEERAFELDDNFVTYVDFSKVKSLSAESGKSYSPISIGIMGLKYYKEFLKHKTGSSKQIFLAHADWLVENIDDGFWYLEHRKKIYGELLDEKWPSALAQGVGISVLTRAHLVTGDDRYKTTALKALKPFQMSIKEGGIATKFPHGVAFEEYPTSKPKQVLNGMISSLWGLYDLHYYYNSEVAKKLFDSGIEFLENNLESYNASFWTRYSLAEPKLSNRYVLVSPWYQKLHAVQLKSLCDITNSKEICFHAEDIKRQEQSSYFNFIIYPAYSTYEVLTYIRTLALSIF